jgi:hypothetical protein
MDGIAAHVNRRWYPKTDNHTMKTPRNISSQYSEISDLRLEIYENEVELLNNTGVKTPPEKVWQKKGNII